MQLAAKYKKPTIVARLNDEGMIRGSARGLSESELKDFKEYLNSTSYFEYTAGHPNAFGISINDDNLKELHEKANDELEQYNFNEDCYEVNFERNAVDEDLDAIIREMDSLKDTWGQQNPEPYIAVNNINIKQTDVQIMGKNSDTVKFEKFGIIYIKFHAKDLINELSEYRDMQIDLVGRPNLNEWMGNYSPQIFIEDYNIRDGSLEF